MIDLNENDSQSPDKPRVPELRRPRISEGGELWRLARDSKVLDLNTSYAYLLWARDFANTSVIAVDTSTSPERAAGFVSGYRRPDAPEVFMVWQVATDDAYRGQGLARRMLDFLVADPAGGPAFTHLETTITDDNEASIALFSSFATRQGAEITKQPLFTEDHFPDPGHGAEFLYRIGPFAR